jgi:hypothetical protein
MQTEEKRYTEWKKMIEEQKVSGQSKAAYCKAKGISENRFYYYSNKLKHSKPEILTNVKKFIPVDSKNLSSVNSVSVPSELRLILKNGIECVLPEGVSSRWIKEVIGVLVQC